MELDQQLIQADPLSLVAAVSQERGLEYWMLVVYALAMGTIGAFMMPARDAILNDVVSRRRKAGCPPLACDNSAPR